MKGFFGSEQTDPVFAEPVSGGFGELPSASVPALAVRPYGRIAVYDSLTAAPRVEDVAGSDPPAFIEQLATQVYQLARDQGGRVPYTLIREIVENSIHARFAEVVVSIMDDGNTIRFSDQGPGIPDKEKAFLPGFSTASSAMKQVIRGVGSGLPIVRECLAFSDGFVTIEDNIGNGTVVTLRVQPAPQPRPEPASDPEPEAETAGTLRLSVRQKQVLSLVMELGSVGPSSVSKELRVALSTAYRDLAFLESAGLMAADDAGKRALTEDGVTFLDDLFK